MSYYFAFLPSSLIYLPGWRYPGPYWCSPYLPFSIFSASVQCMSTENHRVWGWVKLILPIVPPLAPLSPMIVPPSHPQTVSPISAKACRGQLYVEEGRTCGLTRIKLDGLTANPLKGVRIRCTVGVQVRGNNQPGIKKVPRIARLSTSLSIVSATPS